jgi:hypothetical protein
LARKGYRFIGKIEAESSLPAELVVSQSETAQTGIESATIPAELECSAQVPVENVSITQPFAEPKDKNRWILAGALAIVVLAAGIVTTFLKNSRVKSAPEMTRLTFDSGLTTDPAVSPDGKLLAYATDRKWKRTPSHLGAAVHSRRASGAVD